MPPGERNLTAARGEVRPHPRDAPTHPTESAPLHRDSVGTPGKAAPYVPELCGEGVGPGPGALCKPGVMEPIEILKQAADTLTVRRVFGEPIERDGVLVVPVARVRGAGGAGGGEGRGGPGNEEVGRGSGGGWTAAARPVGVFVISGGDVRWVPAFDLNRVILGGQVVAVVALLVARSIVRRRRARAERRR
jgi:uncharacterized spore protein YtfJ